MFYKISKQRRESWWGLLYTAASTQRGRKSRNQASNYPQWLHWKGWGDSNIIGVLFIGHICITFQREGKIDPGACWICSEAWTTCVVYDQSWSTAVYILILNKPYTHRRTPCRTTSGQCECQWRSGVSWGIETEVRPATIPAEWVTEVIMFFMAGWWHWKMSCCLQSHTTTRICYCLSGMFTVWIDPLD